MPNSPHITNPRAPSQYFVLFCSKLQFYECVNTFSMDTELRNDRIPRNPFDRQFLDMRYLNEPETDHLEKNRLLMWWTTHPAAYTRCCSGSQVPCHYFSLIGTIRACFLNYKEHTAEKKMADFALPSSPYLIFKTR